MLKNIYQSPFRVYLCLFGLAIIGVWAGMQLPISLYPNSTKPHVWVQVSYGKITANEFVKNYGHLVENKLMNLNLDDMEVEEVVSEYGQSNVWYEVKFKWGAKPKAAQREVQMVMSALSASWPEEIRDSVNVNFWSDSSGFVAISYYSDKRDLNEIYNLLEPLLTPLLSKVEDAEGANLWNPDSKEVVVNLNSESMASFGLFPKDIEGAIKRSLQGYRGGQVTVGRKTLMVEMPRLVQSLESLEKVLIQTPKGQLIHLSQISDLDFRIAKDQGRVYKTNGNKSLILFADPKKGGNVKKMAEDIISIVKEVHKQVPQDIQYKILVDPSEFIRKSVENVIREVFLAAGLAVFVLFLFIGNFRNTITAAVEIPMSMVLAFILMKITDMNLNLISLGGLALSAGMNVDASVVVMENIFRHLENVKTELNIEQKISLIVRAVKEVMLPVIAATISSLVVFLPLAFTSDLTYAVLGDLAKAVVFSHGFSALVALVLVPTIRFHIMRKSTGIERVSKSPIEGFLKKMEQAYANLLEKFIKGNLLKFLSFALASAALVVLIVTVLPKLKKEVIGMPDTDWVILGVNTSGNTLIGQMEEQTAEIEDRLLQKFADKIKYTFVQVRRPNRSNIMARLKNKSEMNAVWKQFEEEFVNTPTMNFWVVPWNPAELPLPNPPQLKISIRGGNTQDRILLSDSLWEALKEKDVYPRLNTEPDTNRKDNIVLRPYLARWPLLMEQGASFSPSDLTDYIRVVTEGRHVDDVIINEKSYPIKLNFPLGTIDSKKDVESLPIGVGEKIIPLRALAKVEFAEADPTNYRINGKDQYLLTGKINKGEESEKDAKFALVQKVIQEFREKKLPDLNLPSKPTFNIEEAEVELNTAMKQLAMAVGLSILLILLTLIFQFGHVVHCMIILSAIPLGIIGVLISLFVFQSTLSLNSILGVILLNGIAVANSIILVDFIIKLVKDGYVPRAAAVLAARKRLRPILITSLTTILGMVPIAMGHGDGGKILQPLGIAVAGGLWFSMIFTLFIVPALEVMYFEWQRKRGKLEIPVGRQNESSEEMSEESHSAESVMEVNP